MFLKNFLFLFTLASLNENLNADDVKLKCHGFPYDAGPAYYHYYPCYFYHSTVKENDVITITKPVFQEIEYAGGGKFRRLEPFDATPHIKQAGIKESTFYTVPSQIFEMLPKITNFGAHGQKIQVITEDSFKYATEMTLLSLRDNEITKLDKMIFNEAKKLDGIFITGNKIESIDETTFHNLKLLKTLSLSHNKISELTTEHLKDLTSLETIEMDYNNLESLPDDLFINSVNLKSVQFNNNKLKSVGSAFKNLNKLENLYISQNLLKELEIPNNYKLEKVEADNNELENFSMTTYLLHLSVGNNKLSKIEFNKNERIKFLNISGNALDSDFIFNILLKKKHLETLDLSYNHIGEIQIEAFSGLQRVKVLKLKSTDISGITYGTFSGTTDMEELDISYNNFKKFDLQKLNEMKRLKLLHIEGNLLKKMAGVDKFVKLPYFERVRLSDNDWECDFLLDLITKVRANRIEVPHPVTNLPNVNGIVCHETESDEN